MSVHPDELAHAISKARDYAKSCGGIDPYSEDTPDGLAFCFAEAVVQLAADRDRESAVAADVARVAADPPLGNDLLRALLHGNADEIGEAVDLARDLLRDRHGAADFQPIYERVERDKIAAALVQLADRCVVGVPCEKHHGVVHGGEAEQLRRGIQKIIAADFDDYPFALRELLDEIDARDSLAFLEATRS